MRATKRFFVIAYDISNTKRRNRVIKILRPYGVRVNFSVFECMLTNKQTVEIKERIHSVIDGRYDRVIYYPLCLDCYSKIEYQPDNMPGIHRVVEIV